MCIRSILYCYSATMVMSISDLEAAFDTYWRQLLLAGALVTVALLALCLSLTAFALALLPFLLLVGGAP